MQHIVEAMRAYTHEFMNKLHVILGLLQLGEAKQAAEQEARQRLMIGLAAGLAVLLAAALIICLRRRRRR